MCERTAPRRWRGPRPQPTIRPTRGSDDMPIGPMTKAAGSTSMPQLRGQRLKMRWPPTLRGWILPCSTRFLQPMCRASGPPAERMCLIRWRKRNPPGLLPMLRPLSIRTRNRSPTSPIARISTGSGVHELSSPRKPTWQQADHFLIFFLRAKRTRTLESMRILTGPRSVRSSPNCILISAKGVVIGGWFIRPRVTTGIRHCSKSMDQGMMGNDLQPA